MQSESLNIINKHSDEILGNIDYHYEFYSRYLRNERDIIVWTPYGYTSRYHRYPVVYMHDGQNLFNPNTSFIGYDWKVDETILRLLDERRMREVIVVGIYNTKDRIDEYNLFTEKGRAYSSFIINELKPFIDSNYSTDPGRNSTAVAGSSLGGLCSFQLIWNFPHVFGKAACMSNSFWVDQGKIFEHIKNDLNIDKRIKLYMDCGDKEKELIKDNRKMASILKLNGYNSKKKFYWHIEKGGVHSEIDWAKRLEIPLTYLFGYEND